jgi:hypothetical protein
MYFKIYDVFYSINSHQYVQVILVLLQHYTGTYVVLCCVADTPSQLKNNIVSVENI